MRAVFGVLSLLIVLAFVGMLAKKQLGAVSATRAQMPNSAVQDAGISLPLTSPGQAQSLQIQQLKQKLEASLQQARPLPDAP